MGIGTLTGRVLGYLPSMKEPTMNTTALAPLRQDLVLTGPVGSLEAYMQAVRDIPVLSAEEERALAVRYREQEDLDAARLLFMHHLRFVVHVARVYLGYGLPL